MPDMSEVNGGGPSGDRNYHRMSGTEEKNNDDEDDNSGDSDDSEKRMGFAESALNTGHHEDAERWMERLRKLTKNRYRKLEKDDNKEVEEYMIYAGDERGNIVIWDILPTLESL